MEFVQIIVNYFDWESYFIQPKACYDVIRRHGKQVVVMEPVKGGVLADHAAQALRYAAGKDGVLTVLSGMSNLEQMEQNIATMRDFTPLTADEEAQLLQSAKEIKAQGPLHSSDFTKYEKIKFHGIPVAAILDGYNACLVQPNPFFAGELNYLPNELLKLGVTDVKQPFPEETVTLNGEDITPMVKEAWDWLIAHSFAM